MIAGSKMLPSSAWLAATGAVVGSSLGLASVIATRPAMMHPTKNDMRMYSRE
jgi:hypothetical protein